MHAVELVCFSTVTYKQPLDALDSNWPRDYSQAAVVVYGSKWDIPLRSDLPSRAVGHTAGQTIDLGKLELELEPT